MWTLLLLSLDPVGKAPDKAPDLPEAVAYQCPEKLTDLPDLLKRRCRDAVALQATPQGSGTRPVIILPAAAAAAAGIALGSAKGDPPISR